MATIAPPAGTNDNTGGNNSSTASTTINTVQANLAITKSDGIATINAGASTTYSIAVSNGGPAAADGAIFTDPAVVNLTITGVTCGSPTGGAACPLMAGVTIAAMQGAGISIPALPNGGSVTFSVTGTAGTTGSIVNIASIAAPAGVTDPTPGNNSATDTDTIQPVADLAIVKSNGVTNVVSGSPTTYTLTVTNIGPSSVTGAVLTDSVAAGLSKTAVACSATPGQCVTAPTVAQLESGAFALPALVNGQTYQLTVTANVTAANGSVTNTASIAVPGGITDPVAANNSDNDTDIVNASDLALVKTTASSFSVGGSAIFLLTPNNTLGSAPTVGTVTVIDVLPAGLTYVAAGSGGTGWTCLNVGQTVTCTSSAIIAAGATGNTISINVSVASNAVPSVTNTATISGGNEPSANSGNNSAVLTVPVSNMAVNTFLTDGSQTGLPGTSLLYTHVFNAGVIGTVSFSATHTATPPTPGWTVQIYRDTNCNGALDGSEGAAELMAGVGVIPGDQVCIIVKSNIPAAAPFNGQDVITVTATFTPTVGANVFYTRQDITTVGAAGGAGLVLTKSVRNVTQGGVAGTANTAKPGDVLEYVITYSNNSSTPVTTVVIGDNTPAFTVFALASCGMPLPAAISACAVTTQPAMGGAGNIQWTLTGALNAGQSGGVIFRVNVQ